jgi:hypothetical protein
LHKLQLQENSYSGKGEKFSFGSTSIDESIIENDFQNSSIMKQNKEKQTTVNTSDKNKGNNLLLQSKILAFILFFILLIWQLVSYLYYYLRLVTYEDCIQYEYYTSLYTSIYIFPFIGLREYLFDRHSVFYGETIDKYTDDILKNFYVKLSERSNQRDQYQGHFPEHFRNFMNELYTTKICKFVLDFNQAYPENGNYNCSHFFFGSPDYGLLSVLSMYIEEIRSLVDIIDNSYIIANNKNYTYNESYFQDPKGNYERHQSLYNNTPEQYNDYLNLNPTRIIGLERHKNLLIVYRFIISEVLSLLITESYKTFDEMFSDTDNVCLIINIIFIIFVSVGFLLVWLPYVQRENETIFRAKNMLSIIPNEILINLPHINMMLGNDEQKA